MCCKADDLSMADLRAGTARWRPAHSQRACCVTLRYDWIRQQCCLSVWMCAPLPPCKRKLENEVGPERLRSRTVLFKISDVYLHGLYSRRLNFYSGEYQETTYERGVLEERTTLSLNISLQSTLLIYLTSSLYFLYPLPFTKLPLPL